MENKNLMPAGRYYVGDLCYVMSDHWGEFCDKSFRGPERVEGLIVMDNGVKTVHFGTAYGDGCYDDQFGNEYPVDAGLIGCIRVEDITDPDADLTGGNIMEFETPFDCCNADGVLYFGHVCIDTKCEDDEDDEIWDDDEEED